MCTRDSLQMLRQSCIINNFLLFRGSCFYTEKLYNRKKQSKHLSKINKAYFRISHIYASKKQSTYFPKKANGLCCFGKVELGLSIRLRPLHLARPLS